MKGYKIVQWNDAVSKVCNSRDNPLYKEAGLHWSRPTIWAKEDSEPRFDTEKPFLYSLVRNHGKSLTKDHIVYIGLTTAPRSRFGNHETAHEIVKKNGQVKFSYAPVDFISGKNRIERIGKALEEIEHLLIWAVRSKDMCNERKCFTLPGMGKNGGNAWHIFNTGYRFCGRMPREIVFPWMIAKLGRDRTAKPR
ncbi:hypothetical protein [Methylocella tundrae]|uniref:GIY-YIG domain-containing protein n=1 Tax=Methylocella tundrae TaxID=227605 RepID=A0A4U8Z588_METTU|nr:hypothetical protein [Methylocella tundrae]WPP04203.1 hypothetical protein SIN04_17385 [Methylocella tundrae]VFU10487.1 conserved protein of unknown function [Methylocella tundrae]